jgi:hypothetical protein
VRRCDEEDPSREAQESYMHSGTQRGHGRPSGGFLNIQRNLVRFSNILMLFRLLLRFPELKVLQHRFFVLGRQNPIRL